MSGQNIKTILETLVRMQNDIRVKHVEIAERISKSKTLTALQQSVEYTIASAFDMFYNSLKLLPDKALLPKEALNLIPTPLFGVAPASPLKKP